MKIIIKDVGYNRGYVIGPYLQERPGVNADLILEEGEDQEASTLKALHYLKSITDKFHTEANPNLYTPESMRGVQESNGEPMKPHKPLEINLQHERLLISIENATTLEELAPLKEAIYKAGLTSQYMNKVKELTK